MLVDPIVVFLFKAISSSVWHVETGESFRGAEGLFVGVISMEEGNGFSNVSGI